MADLDTARSSLSSAEPPALTLSNKPNKLLSAKLNKVLGSSSADDGRIKAALTALSDIRDLDEADLRRNLRGTIEKKEIEANKQFIQALSNVVEQLETLETQVNTMDQVCRTMKKSLDTTTAETAQMIEQAHQIQERSAASDTRLIIVDKFLERFTLSEEEIKILCSSAYPIDDDFFQALDHLQRIHSDCKLLLMTQNQQAGLQIMEAMTLHQETAYEKLYRWTQYETRASFGKDSIDVSSLMTKALHALMHRPVLFQTILDEIAVARREAVSSAFMTALTRGGPGGTPRPIELQAHDSLRYVGDMLAWIHQAAASEKEMLESLFQKGHSRADKRSPHSDRSSNSAAEDVDFSEARLAAQVNDAISDLLDCAMEGTARPLKSRTEQVLVLQPGAITSYRMANLIQFYAVTIGKLMRKQAALAKILYEITGMAYKYFFKTLDAQADRLLQSADPPSKSLTTSPVVRDMTLQLKEILSSYDSSLIMASGLEDEQEFDFNQILDALVNPLLRMCELSVEKFPKIDQEIYMVNCMHHVQTALSLYDFTESKRKGIAERIDRLMKDLAADQYRDLLAQSGLEKIHETLESKDAQTPLSKLPDMDTQSISAAMAHFDSFLIMVSADMSPRLRRLATSQHCQEVQDGAIRLLLDAYRRIHKAVEDPSNQYEYPDRILPRTVEEMEAIFSFAL
ncbi:oligomeric Golgi complex subunit 6 [Syncephalastrum racemosum]|uniref:Conserved oligomeric Golgi complex subunit 6 n=1 Tax=Syncephalastrum racemosum TaxID=13706 RepID=A0A1X2HT81_SYNRA|nr:oligomeric Golgi complex subunit 6 [Syncephalastrum racemosum]